MPLDVFRERASQLKVKTQQLVTDFDTLLPGLLTVTKEQRAHLPRLRIGEHSMLQLVLDVVDFEPVPFKSLADSDEGMDPQTFETPLLRERIEKHKAFMDLADTLEPVATKCNDTALHLAGLFRDAVYAAYRIAKTLSKTDTKINTIVAPVIDFFSKKKNPPPQGGGAS